MKNVDVEVSAESCERIQQVDACSVVAGAIWQNQSCAGELQYTVGLLIGLSRVTNVRRRGK